jgi:hypothetical protein
VIALRVLFPIKVTNPGDSYDVFPDGKKFLVDAVTTEDTSAPLNLVLNWRAEFKR